MDHVCATATRQPLYRRLTTGRLNGKAAGEMAKHRQRNADRAKRRADLRRLPVKCPSKKFGDSRFTINGWVRRAAALQAA